MTDRRIFFAAVLMAAASPGAFLRGPRVPDLQVLSVNAKRNDEGLIEVESRVRNSGTRPLKKLTVIFRFVDSDGATVSSQRMEADEAVLEPQAEASISGQMRDTPRAVQVKVDATDARGIELRVGNPGPFDFQ